MMQRFVEKGLKQKKAAEMLQVTERHVRRTLKGYRRSGGERLFSKRRGKPSNNQLKEDVKQGAIDSIYRIYTDFELTLAHEKLTEQHGLKLSQETVR